MPQSMGFPATDRGGSLGGTTLLRRRTGLVLAFRPGWMGGQEQPLALPKLYTSINPRTGIRPGGQFYDVF